MERDKGGMMKREWIQLLAGEHRLEWDGRAATYMRDWRSGLWMARGYKYAGGGHWTYIAGTNFRTWPEAKEWGEEFVGGPKI